MVGSFWNKVTASMLGIQLEEVTNANRRTAMNTYVEGRDKESLQKLGFTESSIAFGDEWADLHKDIKEKRDSLSKLPDETLLDAVAEAIKDTSAKSFNGKKLEYKGDRGYYTGLNGERFAILTIDTAIMFDSEGAKPTLTVTFHHSIQKGTAQTLEARYEDPGFIYHAYKANELLVCNDREWLLDIAAGYYDDEFDGLLSIYMIEYELSKAGIKENVK
jgi:hypothetical protein